MKTQTSVPRTCHMIIQLREDQALVLPSLSPQEEAQIPGNLSSGTEAEPTAHVTLKSYWGMMSEIWQSERCPQISPLIITIS